VSLSERDEVVVIWVPAGSGTCLRGWVLHHLGQKLDAFHEGPCLVRRQPTSQLRPTEDLAQFFHQLQRDEQHDAPLDGRCQQLRRRASTADGSRDVDARVEEEPRTTGSIGVLVRHPFASSRLPPKA
jgi:hypothetical protein